MTSVEFYFNTPSRLETACRLVRKALRAGAATEEKPLVVYCSNAARLAEFDDLLYTFADDDFLPHVAQDHPMAEEAPVILSSQPYTPEHPRTPHLLINLDDAVPEMFSRYTRLLEVVGPEEADRTEARKRFSFYRDRGYPMTRHDLGHAPETR